MANGQHLDAEIERLAQLAEPSFVNYLRSERIVRCGGNRARITDLLPDAHQAWRYRPQRARLIARWLLAQGQRDKAVDQLADAIHDGDLDALRTLWPTMKSIGAHRSRPLLDATAANQGDHTARGISAQLALICQTQRDATCVRHHGFRAAALGSRRVIPALRWLSANASTPRIQRAAEAWVDSLTQEK